MKNVQKSDSFNRRMTVLSNSCSKSRNIEEVPDGKLDAKKFEFN
jgi:hypothetical protein